MNEMSTYQPPAIMVACRFTHSEDVGEAVEGGVTDGGGDRDGVMEGHRGGTYGTLSNDVRYC